MKSAVDGLVNTQTISHGWPGQIYGLAHCKGQFHKLCLGSLCMSAKTAVLSRRLFRVKNVLISDLNFIFSVFTAVVLLCPFWVVHKTCEIKEQ